MNDIDIAIERIKNDETILVDLLNDEGANIILKKSGESIGSGRCIFHGGSKNKLYILNRKDGCHFKCQSKCKIYGDVFDLLYERKGLDIIDSIKYINDKYSLGINIKPSKLDNLISWIKNNVTHPNKEAYPDGKVDNVYVYTDKDNNPLYVNIRFFPKDFRQYSIIDEGEYYKLQFKGRIEKLVPYKFPKISKAINDGKTIFIVEGEKDADNLEKLGLTATSLKMKDEQLSEYAELFRGAHISIIGDKDEAGDKYVNNIKKYLYEYCRSIRVVNIPLDIEKADITDYIEELKKNTFNKSELASKIYELNKRSLDLKNENELQQDDNGIYYIHIKETKEEVKRTKIYISNFKIAYANIYRSIDTDDQKIELKLISNLGKSTIIKSDARTLFTDIKNFRKVLGIDYVYKSNSNFLPRLQTWILTYFINKDVSSYSITGIRNIDGENVLVTNNGILHSDGTFNTKMKADNDIHDMNFEDMKPLTKEEGEELCYHLLNFNKKQIVYNTLGLSVAHLLNYFVRESKLDNLPILQNIGESNSGKSKTFAIIKDMLNISSKPLAYSNITEFTILRAFSNTYMPLLIDELKPSKNPIHKLNMISNHIRNCTEGYKAQKGRKDLSTIEYNYLASMMISGEELINENAVINRSNISWYSRSNFTDKGAVAVDFLVRNEKGNDLLKRFSLTLYTQILKRYSPEYISDEYSNIRNVFKFDKIEDDRIKNTAIYTMLGITEINHAFKTIGVDEDSLINLNEAKELIERNLLENVMDSDEEGQVSEYEQILLLIDKLAGSSDLTVLISHGDYYKKESEYVFFDFMEIWDKLNLYMSKYSNGGKLMDRKEFQKHIRKSKYAAGPKSEDYYVPIYLSRTVYTKAGDRVEKNKRVKTYKLKSSELYNLGMNNIVSCDDLKSCTGNSKVIPFNDNKDGEKWTSWEDIYGDKEYNEID